MAIEVRSRYGLWKTAFGAYFEYAHLFKHLADEKTAGEHPASDDRLTRSHQLARYTTRIVRDGFKAAGVELTPPEDESDGLYRRVIHNPLAENGYVQVLWKAEVDEGLLHQNYRIHLINEEPGRFYFIHDVTSAEPEEEETLILKTGIIGDKDMDSDIDFRPPSAGRVATFVVPLARAAQDGSLIAA